MDIKEIAQKSFAGEDVSSLTKDFTDEQKVAFTKAELELATNAKNEALGEVTALRKEKTRLADLTSKQGEDFQKQVRSEQVDKASAKIAAEFGLSPEEVAKVRETFTKVDTGKVDADLIYEDMKRAYVVVNADSLIQAKKDKEQFEKNAAEFNSGAAAGGSSNGGGSGSGDKQYSQEVHDMVKEAGKRGVQLTLEQAERGMKSGTRVFGQ